MTVQTDPKDLAVHETPPGEAHARTSVYVYEAPVRLWHWINALAIVVLSVTGYLIGSPLHSTGGSGTDNFLMGGIRFVHFTAAYVFAIGFLARLYWAFVGNHHARQLFTLPFWNGAWWRELFGELKWYLFLEKEPKKYVGHNPLAHAVMFFVITLGSIFMILTGFALYAEGTGHDSWQWAAFGWMTAIFPNTQGLHTWHHLGMWVIILFVMVHVYAAVREDIMSRQSIISTMISGERMFKDNRP
ncbi:Ni/Fe-hydrogenase, b-type cytochrome subunit [Telmatospirillum sp. J64-1]|uniref:Ni/Fe-hydrogenase, b-type cytochrome subunit n=1 Tax=Telmatospirillum sp. J64-1 TaxID=2502183 RepID=UPI00115DB385|nr:Ni/Fe-hydrogenase, b-type cytochrome subunit [Telmatospirillum sp. J64-1]